MKKWSTLLLFALVSLNSFAVCMALPDIELKGKTSDQKKCEVLINSDEKYVSFEAGKQMCTFTVDDESLEELKDHKRNHVTFKGYSNWFDCKVKLIYDDKGRPYKAKISSRLTLALTFMHDECIFE